jgi:nucleoside-diphosphate-sugar epimerase
LEIILVIGANGQIGSELVTALMKKNTVIAADKIGCNTNLQAEIKDGLRYYDLDVTDSIAIEKVVKENKITQIYHLAALMSGKAEDNRVGSWNLNVNGLLNVLETSLKYDIKKVFWPSSMASYGPVNGKRIENAMQSDPLFPQSIYGASKVSGEALCYYYANRKGIDIRTIRYPGLISTKTPGGGGTTDYAIDIFFAANKGEVFDCFLKDDSMMEMLHMDDAVNGTIQLMETDKKQLDSYIPYNIGGLHFTPLELYSAIKVYKPDFKINYKPDIENRQKNADSWPAKINDDKAKQDWLWSPKYNTLDKLTKIMLEKAFR